LENKIKELEKDLKRNHETVQKIAKSVAELLQKASQPGEKVPKAKQNKSTKSWSKFDAKPEISDCFFADNQPPKSDIHMLDVYNELKFDNPDGGAWKQGWDVQYDPSQFSESKKLKVFLVPHSHNDPGWIKTFEKYFSDQTKHILDNLVQKISEDSRRKFIWAEISYLDLWWKSSDSAARNQFKELVKSGQVEIVTGGWVMNDEANTHYYAMIEQLTSGHEWLVQRMGITPQNGWAIDPFGMSASMAYLLKRAGLENMVIQRVHYAIKKAFALKKNLEFRWRQNWGKWPLLYDFDISCYYLSFLHFTDRDGQTDMLCHMMPFYSYDVPHTCGPDPKVCCQFDFRRMNTGFRSGQTPIGCPWKIPSVPITDANVDKKARLLLDQYRKKASLYKTNVLLVQLGDDFRYDTALEFDQQFINYQKLFDHMNNLKELSVEVKHFSKSKHSV
jgi:alpha-mannosidase II